MNKLFKTNLIILLIAIVPSLAVVRWNTISNVPFCIHSAGCSFNIMPKGTITERQYGFPVTYRATSIFRPENNNQNDPNYAGYAEAQAERQALILAYVLVNIMFWFALLHLIAKWLPKKKPAIVAVVEPDSHTIN